MLLHDQSHPSASGDYSSTGRDQMLRERRKRSAQCAGLGSSQEPLSKRMSLMNLDHPVLRRLLRNSAPPQRDMATTTPTSQSAGDAAVMDVDETPDRIFIRSLDDELSSSDSDVDVEHGAVLFRRGLRRGMRGQPLLPRSLLRSLDPDRHPAAEAADMQLVVYREPESLTVPPEFDSVRRAVVEARERVRHRQAHPASSSPSFPTFPATSLYSDYPPVPDLLYRLDDPITPTVADEHSMELEPVVYPSYDDDAMDLS